MSATYASQFHIFDAPWLREAQFKVDQSRRTISGMVVPWGTWSGPESISGHRFRFTPETLDVPKVPSKVAFLVDHDEDRQVGRGLSFQKREDGLYGAFKVDPGRDGDEALSNASSGRWGGLSFGSNEVRSSCACPVSGKHCDCDASSATINEVSLVDKPAFRDARVHQVAASEARAPEPALLDPMAETNDWNPPAPLGMEKGYVCDVSPGTEVDVNEHRTRTVIRDDGSPLVYREDRGRVIREMAYAAVVNNRLGGVSVQPSRGLPAHEVDLFWSEVRGALDAGRTVEAEQAAATASRIVEEMTA